MADSGFPKGPPAGDRVTRRSDEAVRFETPAGPQGLGTADDALAPGDRPIEGVMFFDAIPEVNGLATVSVRLPQEKQALVEAILARFEEEAEAGPKKRAEKK